MPNKTCFKCGQLKPLEDFYKHPRMTDGRVNKCKECNKADNRKNRLVKRSQYAAYERERFQRPERKAQVSETEKRRMARFPEKKRAVSAVNNAIRDGRLKRGVCEVCGNDNAQAHHEDYFRPLDVRWLCFKHHRMEHGQLKQVVFVAVGEH